MTTQDWPKVMASLIAASIRHYREERGLSTQRLADVCKNEVGYEVPRATIVNLERGRREAITIIEWLTLAEALKVPPVLLLYPVGRTQDPVQVLPGVDVRPFDAVEYLMTRVRPLNDAEKMQFNRRTAERERTIDLFRDHDEKVAMLDSLTKSIGHMDRFITGEAPNLDSSSLSLLRRDRRGMQQHVETLCDHIKQTRASIRALGLIPHKLPLKFRYLDEVPSAGADVLMPGSGSVASFDDDPSRPRSLPEA